MPVEGTLMPWSAARISRSALPVRRLVRRPGRREPLEQRGHVGDRDRVVAENLVQVGEQVAGLDLRAGRCRSGAGLLALLDRVQRPLDDAA